MLLAFINTATFSYLLNMCLLMFKYYLKLFNQVKFFTLDQINYATYLIP